MKKNDHEWFINNSRFLAAKLHAKLKRGHRKYDTLKYKDLKKTIGSTLLIEAPRFISIYSLDDLDNNIIYHQTMEFRDKLKNQLSKKPAIIDFTETEEITAAALVMLYATVDSSKNTKLALSVRWSKSPRVNNLLRQSNFHKMVAGIETNKALADKRALPVISGVGKDRAEDILDFVKNRFYGPQMDGNTEHLYGDAVTETVNNVGRHAYPNKDILNKKWWLLCDVIGDNLYLAIFDLGVGIPQTVVKHKWFFRNARQVYPDQCSTVREQSNDRSRLIFKYSLSDEDLINLSMQGDVTGTRKPQHGQGSKSIKALVSETDGGKLWVFSNKGLLTYESENEPPILYKLPVSLGGTLIQWNIKLR